MGYFSEYIKEKRNETSNNESNKQGTSGFKQYSDLRKKGYDPIQAKDYLDINFDTLQSDMTSLNDTIKSVYGGWQPKSTMKSTRSSIQNIYDRLGKYEEFYGADENITKIRNSYKSVLDDWDDLSKYYGGFKSKDAYNKAKKANEEYQKVLNEDLGSLKYKKGQTKKILDEAEKYEKEVQNVLPNGVTRAPNNPNTLKSIITEKTKARDDFLKSHGYGSIEELREDYTKQNAYFNRALNVQQKNLLSKVSDETSEFYDKDFDELSKYNKDKGYSFWSESNEKRIYDYINADEDTRLDMVGDINSSADAFIITAGYQYMTDDEIKTYNYYFNKFGDKEARKYLDSFKEELSNRHARERFEGIKGNTAKELLFGAEAGFDQFVNGLVNAFNTKDDYIPVNSTQQLSGMVREDLSERHGGWGTVPYDLINTTSNMLPSVLTSTAITYASGNPVLGSAIGTSTMGVSASGNAYQEMLNLGYDKGQARTYANLVGASESLLQYALGGIGKLGGTSARFSKMVSGIDNGLAKFAIRFGGSMASEGIEEAVQEVLTPMFKNYAAGYDTGEKIDWGEVVYSGLLGAMSGGLWEGGPAISNARAEVHTGKNIKTNERVSDMFDLANNPEIAEAYETYTRYAKKGITADNVTNAQLGRLYNEVKSDAVEKMNSKNSTDEQRASGMQTLGKLALMKTENTIAKEKNKLNVGEETKVTETGEAVDIKALKVKGEDVVLNTEKGEVSTDKITLADTDADIVAHAKVIARTDGEDVANLFLSQYNGETNIDEYANSFNLTVAYAKNDFRFNQILENKGKLSTDQVNTIYAEARKIAVAENEKAIAELNKKMADGKFYKGIIDESVINYGEEDVEGKVKWTSLNSRQRQAVTFIKGFAQATGMNVAFVANNPKYNGKYDKETNTITINLDEGGFDAIKNIEETIIPTMSHETTHWMKNKSPELWENLNNIVFSTLTEHYNSNKDLKLKKALVEVIDGKTYTDEELKSRTVTKDDLIDAEYYRLADKAKKDGKKVDAAKLYDTAKEEIIARACEDILSMSEQGRKIFKSLSESEQKTLVEKIKAIINDLINWVDDLLHSYKATSKEAQIMREY
ncbi:MAG: hypothetical protein E7391_04270, partial [Ruminococcaceae bacterium]|nr:hypothetical protein [Oscillospiraceae bacterium]